MKKIILLGILLLCFWKPLNVAAIAVPAVPEEGEMIFPDQQEDFGEGVFYIVKQALSRAQPQIAASIKQCVCLLGTIMILSLLRNVEGKSKAVVELAAILAVATFMLDSTHSMIQKGTDTVWQISSYGKLLLPVMTAALASQGGGISATSIYGATALFDSLLCSIISAVLIPMVYIYLVMAVINALTEDQGLSKLKALCKWAMGWFFKVVLYVFTGYITVTGVISGTADQTAIKATKLTISGMIPVVGGILSDASETILVSAGAVKNATGIYGMLAVLAVVMIPFLTIGAHYLLLKLTAAVSAVFAPKGVSALVEDFSSTMGFVLALVGSVCLIQLISLVCFLKGMT